MPADVDSIPLSLKRSALRNLETNEQLLKLAEVGPVEVGPVEVEMGPVEVGPVELGPAEVVETEEDVPQMTEHCLSSKKEHKNLKISMVCSPIAAAVSTVTFTSHVAPSDKKGFQRTEFALD